LLLSFETRAVDHEYSHYGFGACSNRQLCLSFLGDIVVLTQTI